MSNVRILQIFGVISVVALMVCVCVYQSNEHFIGIDEYGITQNMNGDLEVIDTWGEIHTTCKLTLYPHSIRDTFQYTMHSDKMVKITYHIDLPEDELTRKKLHKAVCGESEIVNRIIVDAIRESINRVHATNDFKYDGRDSRAICSTMFEDLKKPDSMISRYGLSLLDFTMIINVTFPKERAMPKYKP